MRAPAGGRAGSGSSSERSDPDPERAKHQVTDALDWDAVAAALTRGAGDLFDADNCGLYLREQLTTLVRQSGYSLADLETLGRDWTLQFPERCKTPQVTVPFLLGFYRDGAALAEAMTIARGRAAKQKAREVRSPPPPPRAEPTPEELAAMAAKLEATRARLGPTRGQQERDAARER